MYLLSIKILVEGIVFLDELIVILLIVVLFVIINLVLIRQFNGFAVFILVGQFVRKLYLVLVKEFCELPPRVVDLVELF